MLDDDLAQDVSEKYKTLDDLKTDLRGHLEKRLSDKLKRLEEKALIDGLLAAVRRGAARIDGSRRARRCASRTSRADVFDTEDKLDRFLSYSGKTREALVEDWRPSAERSITTQAGHREAHRRGRLRVLGIGARGGILEAGRGKLARP